MGQMDFDFDSPDGKRPASHKSELSRVRANIQGHVLAFCGIVKKRDVAEFHAKELHEYVTEHYGEIAPNSAYRILWELKRGDVLDYEIVNRRQSLYRLKV